MVRYLTWLFRNILHVIFVHFKEDSPSSFRVLLFCCCLTGSTLCTAFVSFDIILLLLDVSILSHICYQSEAINDASRCYKSRLTMKQDKGGVP